MVKDSSGGNDDRRGLQPFILLMQTARFVYFSGPGGFAPVRWAADQRWIPAIIGISGPLCLGAGRAPEMVLLMNEFLNFITYHPDTAEWNGPRRAAKGITSHVF
jgi:hypothetical protein